MKKYILISLIAAFLYSCSEQQNIDIDKTVQEIQDVLNLTENETSTACGILIFKLDGNEIRRFQWSRGMGDGGADWDFYFYDNKLILCHFYSYYDYPEQTGVDAEGNPVTEWLTNGVNFWLYFDNEKLLKCIKEDEEITDLKANQAPNPDNLVAFAKKAKKLINTSGSEELCNEDL